MLRLWYSYPAFIKGTVSWDVYFFWKKNKINTLCTCDYWFKFFCILIVKKEKCFLSSCLHLWEHLLILEILQEAHQNFQLWRNLEKNWKPSIQPLKKLKPIICLWFWSSQKITEASKNLNFNFLHDKASKKFKNYWRIFIKYCFDF